MRISFLCNEYPPGPHGGIGSFTQVLARALVRAGHQVRVIGSYSKTHPALDYQEDHGVRIWRLRASTYRMGLLWSRYELFRAVNQWIRNGEIDLVEAPDCGGWIAGWPRLPVPVVLRLHGSLTYLASQLRQPVSRATFALEQASLRRADFRCSVSRYAARTSQQLFGLATDPVAILYNAVDVPVQIRAVARSSNQVVFTGTLTWNKGIISLIEAWPRVAELHRQAELHIYGKDRLSATGHSVQGLLSRLSGQTRNSVYFHDHVNRERILSALHTARLAVFPSYAESFALAPMEAMACGCPTVYTRRASGPELIEHYRDGLLVDPDCPNEITEAVIRLLANDELAKRLGRAGRTRIEESFSIETVVRQNETFYSSCLSNFSHRAASCSGSAMIAMTSTDML